MLTVGNQHDLCTLWFIEQCCRVGECCGDVGGTGIRLFGVLICGHYFINVDFRCQWNGIGLIEAECDDTEAVTVVLSHGKDGFDELVPLFCRLFFGIGYVYKENDLVVGIWLFKRENGTGKCQYCQSKDDQVKNVGCNSVSGFPVLFRKAEIQQSRQRQSKEEYQKEKGIRKRNF